jgi:hypothetical protein
MLAIVKIVSLYCHIASIRFSKLLHKSQLDSRYLCSVALNDLSGAQ